MLTRKRALNHLSTCGNVLLLMFVALTSVAAADQPNVVFILSDDQAWNDYGFMGHEHIETPNLDALAKQGLLYERGYVTAPLCRPSLASLVTGQYPHQTGIRGNDPVMPNGVRWRTDVSTFAALRKRMTTPLHDKPSFMRLMDEEHLKHPARGSRQIIDFLEDQGFIVNRKRVQRLMLKMGIEGMSPKRRTTLRNAGHQVYPYLLRDLKIERPNQVWCSDITYIPMRHGFMYLVAVLDWFSRHVLSWRLSNSMDADFCIEALDDALQTATPETFNTDQGAQFTSREHTDKLKSHGVAISMDGKGRAIDNVMIERLWRTVKYEEVYLKEYTTRTDSLQRVAKLLRLLCPRARAQFARPPNTCGSIPQRPVKTRRSFYLS